MDLPESQLPVQPQSQSPLMNFLTTKKKLLVIVAGVVLILIIGGTVAIMSSQKQAVPPPSEQSQSEMQKNESAFPTAIQVEKPNSDTSQQVLSIVKQVVSTLKSGSYGQVVPYFMQGLGYWQTADAVATTLRNNAAEFSEGGQYKGEVSATDMQISGDDAQVLVRHALSSKQRTSRYSLRKTGNAWKITAIDYDATLDLLKVKQLHQQQQAVIENTQFSEKPVTFTLPAGDVVEVKKTLFTSLRNAEGRHEDIEVTVMTGKKNYTLALFDGANIVDDAVIEASNSGTFYPVFDIRPLIESKSGLLLFYPEGRIINRSQLGKPPGEAFQIPIKLDVK